jgi:hypothetical protein|tara:strand:+ start:212 stop:586 length:375 start_codon:yes stop_codon:yes gene_type:complete
MMTDKQTRFIEFYSRTGNATRAAIFAGYSEKTAEQKGHELKKLLRGPIQEEVLKHISDCLPAALHHLTDLAENAESESVRLGAIKDLLDRGGLKPIEKVETTSVERMSDDEIQRELDALRRKAH